MRILTGPRGLVPCMLLLVSGLFSATTSFARVVEVVGYAESEIQNPHSFSGLRVTIECKVNKGHFVTRGSGKIDDKGKFNMNIPHEIVSNDGVLMEECYAQLHSAAGTPCPAHDGLESNKIVFLSKTGDRHIMGLKQNLRFTPQLCVSKFFWPMPPFKGFDHHFPLPPPLELPPFPKPCPPKQSPPSVPVYDPPPPVPVHEPPPKVELPPPVPKKPCPPPKVPVPVQKPPPIHKKPCPPKPPKIDIPPPVLE
ncbi:unnamed protein product [Cochlearia groenlandica]